MKLLNIGEDRRHHRYIASRRQKTEHTDQLPDIVAPAYQWPAAVTLSVKYSLHYLTGLLTYMTTLNCTVIPT